MEAVKYIKELCNLAFPLFGDALRTKSSSPYFLSTLTSPSCVCVILTWSNTQQSKLVPSVLQYAAASRSRILFSTDHVGFPFKLYSSQDLMKTDDFPLSGCTYSFANHRLSELD